MRYSTLGRTDLRVSRVCLGTMTFGEQNTAAEAFSQLDLALGAGVNFIDAAEMYPIPPAEKTFGDTERIAGAWLKRRGGRDKLVLATKVSGPSGDWMPWIRDARTRLDRHNIEKAVAGSLERLQTDYIDLYQLHWPDRSTNFFGKLGYEHKPDETATPIEETLSVMADLVGAGKIRHVGVSNETPWGIMRYLHHAEVQGFPRIVSVQNPYSLLNRTFEVGAAEIAHREEVGLLAYSPLAFGVLSGKYLGGADPPGARLTRFAQYTRYSNEQGKAATDAYVRLARRYGFSPAQMALAFVAGRPFVASAIIGATSLSQLRENIDGSELELAKEVLAEIEAVHEQYPNPCP